MVGPAAGFQVVDAGGTAVGERIDVVVFEVVSFPAVFADCPGEIRWVAQVQGGANLGWDVPAEMLDMADLDTVVEEGLQEGVRGELLGQVDRYGTTVDDVAGLTLVGMTAPPRPDVTHDREFDVG
jgi:hypothetical protein